VTYLVNEIFYSIQGEGAHAGRPAVFVRFARCNLWTGREADRATAICQFCDTTFTEVAYRFGDPRDLVEIVTDHLPDGAWDHRTPMVVLTGGEPTLQVDAALVSELLAAPLYVAIETNGTRAVPFWLDWICVSPKAGAPLQQRHGDELKLVYPQPGLNPADLEHLNFDRFSLSPMDGPDLAANTRAAYDYALAHPRWNLSTQTHKTIGVR
jgi:7-carboxy-7-deazaguanine synthase (Cx14CxxC type)